MALPMQRALGAVAAGGLSLLFIADHLHRNGSEDPKHDHGNGDRSHIVL